MYLVEEFGRDNSRDAVRINYISVSVNAFIFFVSKNGPQGIPFKRGAVFGPEPVGVETLDYFRHRLSGGIFFKSSAHDRTGNGVNFVLAIGPATVSEKAGRFLPFECGIVNAAFYVFGQVRGIILRE